MSNQGIAVKFISAWKQAIKSGDSSGFKQLFTPGFVYHDHQVEAPLEGYMQHIEHLTKAARISDVRIKYLVGDGSLFALDFKAQYNFITDVPGMPPVKGKELKTHYLCLLHINNGLIDEGWSAGTSSGL